MTWLATLETSYCFIRKNIWDFLWIGKRTAGYWSPSDKVEHLILTCDQNSDKKSRTAEYRSRLAKLSILLLIFQKKQMNTKFFHILSSYCFDEKNYLRFSLNRKTHSGLSKSSWQSWASHSYGWGAEYNIGAIKHHQQFSHKSSLQFAELLRLWNFSRTPMFVSHTLAQQLILLSYFQDSTKNLEWVGKAYENFEIVFNQSLS